MIFSAEFMDRSNSPSIESILEAAVLDADPDLSWIQPPPADSGWTLALDALHFITNVVRHLQPRHILEFGSGLSTEVLARAAAALTHECSISSIDNDPEHGMASAESYFRQAERRCRVAFQIAPLVARNFGGRFMPAYLIKAERFASTMPVDLVLIDGPPAVLGGREGTLYQAMDYMKPGTLALLDDSLRAEERSALCNWKETLGSAIEVIHLPGFTKGMAAIIVHEPVGSTELRKHRLNPGKKEVWHNIKSENHSPRA